MHNIEILMDLILLMLLLVTSLHIPSVTLYYTFSFVYINQLY